MTTEPNLRKLGIGVGLITASGLMMFFILMKSVHLVQVLELRSLNFFILLTGMLVALNKYKKQNNGHVEYFEGMGLGVFTASVAVIAFAVFIGVYLSFDPEFMEYIKTHAMMGSYLNPSSCALVILVEGISSGLIISFTCMQYFRKFEKGTTNMLRPKHE